MQQPESQPPVLKPWLNQKIRRSVKSCAALASVLDIPVRGGNGGWKNEGSGQHSKLAYVSAGGIILELFFISNDAELQKYFERKEHVFMGIADVLTENFI